LVGDHREVIELGFEAKLIEKVDLDFHGRYLKSTQYKSQVNSKHGT
jgi:hypothetical protein